MRLKALAFAGENHKIGGRRSPRLPSIIRK
jgi:hypothetical protein